MAKKKKEASWDQIGKQIGSKLEKEFKNKDKNWCGWSVQNQCNSDGGFFGRALFIIGVLIALNGMGYLSDVSIWIQILIGVGFALMKF